MFGFDVNPGTDPFVVYDGGQDTRAIIPGLKPPALPFPADYDYPPLFKDQPEN